jgi:hypothetical protein
MSAASALSYGEVIKDYRLLLGIEPERIATVTNVAPSDILSLENGNAPSPAFCQRFLQRTGFIDLFVQSVLQAAEVGSSTEELEKLIAPVIESLKAKPEVADVLWRVITAPEEEQNRHLRFPNVAVGNYGKIPSKTVKSGEHLSGDTPDPQREGDPGAAQGKNVSKPGFEPPRTELDERQQAPKKGAVYERPRSHYDNEYLRKNAKHIAGILGDALENDDPVLTPDRKQALHVIVESIVKKKGASLNKVSREKHIPHRSLWEWVAKGLIPVLYRDRRTIYLANEIAEEVSRDHQDAKEMNYSAARLLRERRKKYFPEEVAQSST